MHDLFSYAAAELGKDVGMALVEQNASSLFMKVAEQAIRDAALRNPEVTINDIWPALEQQGVSTHENRAAGPVMRRCAKNGWIAKTDRTIRSVRSTRHKGDVRVWQSLLYKKNEAGEGLTGAVPLSPQPASYGRFEIPQ